jgi:hypothetical protein
MRKATIRKSFLSFQRELPITHLPPRKEKLSPSGSLDFKASSECHASLGLACNDAPRRMSPATVLPLTAFELLTP